MSSLSGFAMFAPFSLIGLGEIMVNPVLYYYAYAMTPFKTRSVIQAINLVFQGAFPPALVAVFSTLLTRFQPDNLNDGHVEVFYYVSLIIIAIGTPLFFLIERSSTLVEPDENDGMAQCGTSVLSGMLGGSVVEPLNKED